MARVPGPGWTWADDPRRRALHRPTAGPRPCGRPLPPSRSWRAPPWCWTSVAPSWPGIAPRRPPTCRRSPPPDGPSRHPAAHRAGAPRPAGSPTGWPPSSCGAPSTAGTHWSRSGWSGRGPCWRSARRPAARTPDLSPPNRSPPIRPRQPHRARPPGRLRRTSHPHPPGRSRRTGRTHRTGPPRTRRPVPDHSRTACPGSRSRWSREVGPVARPACSAVSFVGGAAPVGDCRWSRSTGRDLLVPARYGIPHRPRTRSPDRDGSAAPRR